jgi:hypothetical protein
MYLMNSHRNLRSTEGWETGFSILFGAIGVLLALFGAYEVISAAQGMVPPGEYRGLIRLGVTLVLILVCGGIFFVGTIFLTAFFICLGYVTGSAVGDLWNKLFP